MYRCTVLKSSLSEQFCFSQDYTSHQLQSVAYTTMRVTFDSSQQCLQCPACVKCGTDAAPTLLPGWSLSPKGLGIWAGGLNVRAPDLSPRSAFRCAVDGKVCDTNATSTPAQSNGQCSEGHTGNLCGVCAPDWKGSFGEVCEQCEASDWRGPAVGTLIMLVLVGGLYARVKKKAAEMQGRLDGMRAKYALARKAVTQARKVQSGAQKEMADLDEEGAFQATLDTIKIVVGNLQIIAQLPVTLKFSCPACEHLKQMMTVLPAVNLDVLKSFSMDCLVTVGLYQRFAYMLIGPAAVIALVLLWSKPDIWSKWVGQAGVQVLDEAAGTDLIGAATRTGPGARTDELVADKKQHDRSAKAGQMIMLIIFLVYPSVSTTIFSVFACRKLDFGQSTHIYDASVDCNSTGYLVLTAAALVALVCIPIGVPVGFAYVLYKNRSRLHSREDDAISFEVFAVTARSVLKRPLTDADLHRMYDLIDTDNSGEVSSEELWKSALTMVHNQASGEQISSKDEDDEVRGSESAEEASAAEASQKKKWWEGGTDEFKFLVRAYEPQCLLQANQTFS